jgi:hypothetical protein
MGLSGLSVVFEPLKSDSQSVVLPLASSIHVDAEGRGVGRGGSSFRPARLNRIN